MRAPLSATLLGWGLVLGCSSPALVDLSPRATEAGDYTLATSACDAVPGGGMDICRVTEGTPMTASWKLVIPTEGRQVQGWEVDVYYRDLATQAHASGTGPLIEIPWQTLFHAPTWTKAQNGEAMALVTVRFQTATGVTEIVQYKGLAKLVVLPPGYSRLPIDSGFAAWPITCKIQYSTAGRSAVSCH